MIFQVFSIRVHIYIHFLCFREEPGTFVPHPPSHNKLGYTKKNAFHSSNEKQKLVGGGRKNIS